MKTIAFISLLLFFASCSSTRLDRQIDDSTWDSLGDESYLRWGSSRLQKSAKTEHPVIGCYIGEAKKTLETYKKDFLAKKEDPYYWLHIGNCYFVLDKWSKAEFYYRMAMEETKSNGIKAIALNNLGMLYFKYEQWEKGKDYLGQSLKLSPKFKIPRYNMAQLYLQFGYYDKAINVLNDSALRGNKDVDVYFSLANAHFYKGDLKQAEEYFKLIPKDKFRREDIAATYALYLIKLGKIREAKMVMDKRERSGVNEITAISQKIEKMISLRLKEDKL